MTDSPARRLSGRQPEQTGDVSLLVLGLFTSVMLLWCAGH